MKQRIEKRVEAYKHLQELKNNIEIKPSDIREISNKFNVNYATLYDWYKYDTSPFGKRKLKYEKELFYILGALLGDGCAYRWKKMNRYMVMLVGEKEFIDKFSIKITECTGRKVKGNINRSSNVWQLVTLNFELYSLLKEIKKDRNKLLTLPSFREYANSLQFVEGYFDAEGCVKVIKESVRKTPKICLDICSTDYVALEIIRKALDEHLSIEARYSIQKPIYEKNKQTAYHLRIYKKEFIRKFFENISTIKLKSEKIEYVTKWLNNGK